MKVISFDSQSCHDLEQALSKEWIETNQFGGYASSSIVSVNTRRYHGLFVPQFKPPLGRHVLLSNLEEIIYIDEIPYPLSSQLFPDTIYPEGYLNLSEFTLLPFPTWTYYLEDLILTKTLVFMQDEQTVIIKYKILEGDKNFVRLEIKPITAFRNIHTLTRQNDRMNTKIDISGKRIHFAGLYLYHNAAILDQSGNWIKQVYYPEEKKRNLDFEEDLYNPFRLVYTFAQDDELYFCASLKDRERLEVAPLVLKEENRRFRLLKNIHVSDSRFQLLAYSGNKFFVNPYLAPDASELIHNLDIYPLDLSFSELKPNGRPSENDHFKHMIVAGYPWFENQPWDALVAFHGLTLSTGQFQLARNVLSYYAAQVENGFLPNQLFDANSPFQTTRPAPADTCLWLIQAVYDYHQYCHDLEKVSELFPVLSSIIESFIKGTSAGVKVAADGLLVLSDQSKGMTWMNAITKGGAAVTPRIGKPVEFQALWFNALKIMAYFSIQLHNAPLQKFYDQLAVLAERSFNRFFWGDHLGYLYDVVNGKECDESLRPNQLLTMGLSFSILENKPEKWRSILDHTARNLLTPFGLRTLSNQNPSYRPQVEGGRFARPETFHQGAVWPWLFIPYITASLKMASNPIEEKKKLLTFFNPLIDHIEHSSLGFISELFDGSSPHHPRELPASCVNLAACLQFYELLTDKQKMFEPHQPFILKKPA